MNKIVCHFKLVTKHKWYVFKNCCRAGIPLQGLLHDLSKFSPTEFFESAKYYTGDRSPIDNCKEAQGISYGWMHHKGLNKHHWEYWVDEVGSENPVGRRMPYKYAVEMICDYIGAGQAYQGKNWTPEGQLKWWKEKRKHVRMHPDTLLFVDVCMFWLDFAGKKAILDPWILKDFWRSANKIC